MDKYFLLYSSCISIKICCRIIILDTQNQNVYFIPNSLYTILTELKEKSYEWIKKHYDQNKIIDEYYDFLIEKELGCFVKSLKQFSEIDRIYTSPYLISNAIIVITNKYQHNFQEIFLQLDEIGCQSVELRFIEGTSLINLKHILSQEQKAQSSITSITIIHPFSLKLIDNMQNLILDYPKIKSLLLYNSPETKNTDIKNVHIVYSKQQDVSNEKCGKVSIQNFSPNLSMFIESYCRKNCLNQKVCIDFDGTIKN